MPLRRDFGRQILNAGRSWRATLDRELQTYGLTSATWRPLFYLGELGDGARAKDLADALGVEPPSMAAVLDRLERDGFIIRALSAGDRRAKAIHMTDKGRQAFDKTVQIAAQVADYLTKGVSDGELEACALVFQRIGQAAIAFPGGEEAF